jgi:hypothetical protein
MNKEFIKRNIVAGLVTPFSDAEIESAIDSATRVLGNLIHYMNGRSHYDEDVAYLARVLLCGTLPS